MKRLRDLYARSRRLPVRVRIAQVSAALTAVILIGFAAVVGRLVSNRLHDDFEKELRTQAGAVATYFSAEFKQPGATTIPDITPSPDAEIRIADAGGNVIASNEEGPSSSLSGWGTRREGSRVVAMSRAVAVRDAIGRIARFATAVPARPASTVPIATPPARKSQSRSIVLVTAVSGRAYCA